MTPEEKAKRYDEALDRAKYYQKENGSAVITAIFPELKETEDERIRKAIISGMTAIKEQGKETFAAIRINDCIAWLEKQGDKDELIKELDEYKAKYTQEVLEKHLRAMNKDDERLRKTTIAFLKDFADKGYENAIECIDWLEKQSEQKSQGKSALEAINEEKVDNQFCVKPVDKAEPKFKIGEWATNGIDCAFQIASIEDGIYYDTNNCGSDIESTDKAYHLWTIQDAKDGDVLVYNNSIFIFNEIHKNWLIYYGIYENDKFRNDKCYSFLDLDTININNIHPATKEQREQLEKAMSDTGYAFDFDKKELKKIKDETSIAVNNPDAYKIGFADGEAHAKEEQWKPSDEQIKHLTYVVYDAKHKNRIYTNGYEPYSYLYALLMQLKKLKG